MYSTINYILVDYIVSYIIYINVIIEYINNKTINN